LNKAQGKKWGQETPYLVRMREGGRLPQKAGRKDLGSVELTCTVIAKRSAVSRRFVEKEKIRNRTECDIPIFPEKREGKKDRGTDSCRFATDWKQEYQAWDVGLSNSSGAWGLKYRSGGFSVR